MNDSERRGKAPPQGPGGAGRAETQGLDDLMARLQSETAAEDVPPRIRALALELQRALDARRTAATVADAASAETASQGRAHGKATG